MYICVCVCIVKHLFVTSTSHSGISKELPGSLIGEVIFKDMANFLMILNGNWATYTCT